MGMYTGVRFKGYVKPEYRTEINKIFEGDEWRDSSVPEFQEYGEDSRSGFIPHGALAYMPDEWECEPYDDFYNGSPTDGFERTYNTDTGYWTFQCSLKNYDSTIETFFDLIPFFVEKIEHLEKFYEEWTYSRQYDLVDGKVVCVNDKFRKYGYED